MAAYKDADDAVGQPFDDLGNVSDTSSKKNNLELNLGT